MTNTIETISLAEARAVIDICERKAIDIKQPMNIAVVDAGGNLVAHIRMDNAWLGSIDISIKKAYTSRAFDISTQDLGDNSQPTQQFFGIHTTNAHGRGVAIFAGGVDFGAKWLMKAGYTKIPLAGGILMGIGGVYNLFFNFNYSQYASRIGGLLDGQRWDRDPWGGIADIFRIIGDTVGLLNAIVNIVAGVCGIAGLICLIPPLTPAVPVLTGICTALGVADTVMGLLTGACNIIAAICRILSVLTMEGDARQIDAALADLRSEITGGASAAVGLGLNIAGNRRFPDAGGPLWQDGPTIPPWLSGLPGTGNSGGGTLTAYLMALDDRIAAAVPSCYITSLEQLFATIGPQDAEQPGVERMTAWGRAELGRALRKVVKGLEAGAA